MNEFYTQNGWKGENYDISRSTKDIAKLIRQDLKSKYPECKFSVTMESYSGGSSITIALMEAPWPAILHGYKHDWKDDREVWTKTDEKDYAQLNQYSFNRDDSEMNIDGEMVKNCTNGVVLSPQCWEVMKSVSGIATSFRMDDSDSMIDYFNTNFYLHINIGKWDKSFKIVKKDISKSIKFNADNKNPVVFESKQPENKTDVVYGEYKGHATITLPGNGKGFTFGLSKAKSILQYIDEIKKFVGAN